MFLCCVFVVTCSGHSKDVLERLLRASSRQDLISFLCVVCNIPFTMAPSPMAPPMAPAPDFKALQPSLALTCTSGYSSPSPAPSPPSSHSPPTLTIVLMSDSQAVLGMESTSRCVIMLLKSVLDSDPGLVGEFFIHCLKHLVAALSSPGHAHSSHAHTGASSHAHTGTSSHTHTGDVSLSSLLLECENTLPMSRAEVTNRAAILHTTAALCEHMGDHVIHHAHLPSLLEACADIITCHAHILGEGQEEVRLEVKREYDEEMMGGPVSLNIVFGLLSAVMAGARKVSGSVYMYVYVCTYVCVCMCVCMHALALALALPPPPSPTPIPYPHRLLCTHPSLLPHVPTTRLMAATGSTSVP